MWNTSTAQVIWVSCYIGLVSAMRLQYSTMRLQDKQHRWRVSVIVGVPASSATFLFNNAFQYRQHFRFTTRNRKLFYFYHCNLRANLPVDRMTTGNNFRMYVALRRSPNSYVYLHLVGMLTSEEKSFFCFSSEMCDSLVRNGNWSQIK